MMVLPADLLADELTRLHSSAHRGEHSVERTDRGEHSAEIKQDMVDRESKAKGKVIDKLPSTGLVPQLVLKGGQQSEAGETVTVVKEGEEREEGQKEQEVKPLGVIDESAFQAESDSVQATPRPDESLGFAVRDMMRTQV